MPYITQENRDTVEPALQALLDDMLFGDVGLVNYVITRIVTETLGCAAYSEINNAIGVLECAKQELYRRVAAPYEDKKKEVNGDVY